MPIYEYTCKDCQNDFEALRSMSQADEPIDCQNCGSRQVSRKVTACYAQSSGSGTLAGMSSGGCDSCAGGNCGSCGH